MPRRPRRITRWLLCLPVLAAVSIAVGQEVATQGVLGQIMSNQVNVKEALGKVPSSLEEVLARALRTNPDILLAESKVRQAQAELNQTRLKVTQDTAGLYYQRRGLREAKEGLYKKASIIEQRVASGTMTQEQLQEALLRVADLDAEMSLLESKLRYAIGLGGAKSQGQGFAASQAQAAAPTKPGSRPALPAKWTSVLDTELNELVVEEATLAEVFELIRDLSGLSIVAHPVLSETNVLNTFTLRKLTVRQALLAISDLNDNDVCFVFRDYGVLAAPQDSAEHLDGATIPPSVPLLR